MSACPFWSTTKENFNCYSECPMIVDSLAKEREEDNCIFKECELSSEIDYKDILKEEYNFLDIRIYDEEKNSNANY